MIHSFSNIIETKPSSIIKHFSHHTRHCDVLVAGGGMTGVACALAAARQGAKVILCQDRPVLGGNASSEIRMHIVGANTGRPNADLQLETRETGIIEEIRLENAYRNSQRSPSVFDIILYEKCRAEPNITLLLNTCVTSVNVSGEPTARVITSAEALRASTEDRFTLHADIFVDCTGDGTLAAAAGAPFFKGREDKEEFGETLAQEKADNKTLGSTILFMARKYEQPMPFIAPPWARKFTEEDLALRPHASEGVDAGLEYGYWWIEWGGELDTIKDAETIRDELLAIVMGIWDHVKNTPGHGAENWALEWVGAVPGKRESRRFIGQYVLTESDLLHSRAFPDAIAYGGWPIDLHPPEGVDNPKVTPSNHTAVPYLYDIPLRTCIAKDFENLLFAGRNLSATHVAFASTRVMATCAAVGQGVGTAAAYAIRHGIAPARLPQSEEAMHAIRQQLLRDDVYLIGQPLRDASDLATQARISASSELPEAPATNVIGGYTRSVSGERGGVSNDRHTQGTNRWISSGKVPQQIELEWSAPVSTSLVELVFDTGLHRHLTLTQSDAYVAGMCWGTGQPELVRDFSVEAQLEDGNWQTIATQTNNWQRLHRFALPEPLRITRLRVTVTAVWGSDIAADKRNFDNSFFTEADRLQQISQVRIARLSVY